MTVNLIVMAMCLSITMYCFFLVEFEMQFLKGDLYKYSAVASLSQFIGCMLSGFLLARVSDRTSSQKGKVNKLRMSITVIYSFMLLGAVLLLFVIEKDAEYQRSIYLSFINVGIGASVVAINVTAVILIPHNHLVNIILLMTLMSNFVSALAPLTAYGFDQPVPIYVMAGCSLIGMVVPCFMSYSNSAELAGNGAEESELGSPRRDSVPPEVLALSIEQ